MKPVILSGVGGSSNWLPLVYPLAAIIAIVYVIDLTVKYFKKKKVERENRLIEDLNRHFEDVNAHKENG